MTAREMTFRTLGRTGLEVSRVGLGAGGPSRLGKSRGADDACVARVVHRALDLGVNIVDTAAAYGTEAAIGAALADVSPQVHIATKVSCYGPAAADGSRPVADPQAVIGSVENSLRCLRREALEIVQLHGVAPSSYDTVVERLYPPLAQLRDQGKIRFIGISETPPGDPLQETAVRACASGLFDTLMIQHAVFDQRAEAGTFAAAREQNVGLFCMSAARAALVSPQLLRGVLERIDPADPPSLEFLLRGPVKTYADAAFRFAAACHDLHVVLVGTGDPEHLRESVAAVLGEALPAAHLQFLKERFGHLDGSLLWRPDE